MKSGSIYQFRETEDSYGIVFEPSTDGSGTFDIIAEGSSNYRFTFTLHDLDSMMHTLKVMRKDLQKTVTIDELFSKLHFYFINYRVYWEDNLVARLVNKSSVALPYYMLTLNSGLLKHVEADDTVVLES